MTDEEGDSGVPRRHMLGLLGGTTAATAVSISWLKPFLEGMWENRDEPGSFGRPGRNNTTDREPETTPEYPGTTDELYDDWVEAIPEACELPSEYQTEVEQTVDGYDELDGDSLTDYVNTGRVQFRRGESEVYMLVDADGDGQYDDNGHSIPDVC